MSIEISTLTMQLRLDLFRRMPLAKLNKRQIPHPRHLLHIRAADKLRQHLEYIPIVQRHVHIAHKQRAHILCRFGHVGRVLRIGPHHLDVAIKQTAPADRRLLLGPNGGVVRRKVDERKTAIALVRMALVDDDVAQLREHLVQHRLDGRHRFLAWKITYKQATLVVRLFEVQRLIGANKVVLQHIHRHGGVVRVHEMHIAEATVLVAKVHHQAHVVDGAKLLKQAEQLHLVHVLGDALQEQLTFDRRRRCSPVGGWPNDFAAIHADAAHRMVVPFRGEITAAAAGGGS